MERAACSPHCYQIHQAMLKLKSDVVPEHPPCVNPDCCNPVERRQKENGSYECIMYWLKRSTCSPECAAIMRSKTINRKVIERAEQEITYKRKYLAPKKDGIGDDGQVFDRYNVNAKDGGLFLVTRPPTLVLTVSSAG
jgi:hypothetical protein